MEIIKEMIRILLIIAFICWVSFQAGMLHQKRQMTERLWQECITLKNSLSPIKRIDNLWLAWQGGVLKSDCSFLYAEDFCTIHKFWED